MTEKYENGISGVVEGVMAKSVDKRIGNEFWKARSSHGRKPKFDDSEILRQACYEYLQWVADNPLYETKPMVVDKVLRMVDVPHMRAATLAGLCLFLDIDEDTWRNYRDKKDFFGVIKEIETAIYNQKFVGASANMLNANIIARDLGLKDTTANEISGVDGAPLSAVLNVSHGSPKPPSS